MANKLPYFRWYPADAELDPEYSSMTDEQLGFYHHCLNLSWLNDGIPADPAARARLLKRNRNQADARWAGVVASRFVPHEHREGYLVNTRQEAERVHAQSKSVKSAESANVRYERSKSNDANAETRAYGSGSVSDSVSQGGAGGIPKMTRAVRIVDGVRFKEWLKPWPRCASPDAAAQAWISVVTSENESAAFAVRDRYLASDEVSRGAVMEPAKFLFAQASAGWAGKWPAVIDKKPPNQSAGDRAIALMKKRIANGEAPL